MSGRRRWLPALALAAGALLSLPQAARADVWGYIDAKGVAHFANEKLDERYELFLRGAATVPAPARPASASPARRRRRAFSPEGCSSPA